MVVAQLGEFVGVVDRRAPLVEQGRDRRSVLGWSIQRFDRQGASHADGRQSQVDTRPFRYGDAGDGEDE